jgi:uncharacterized protein YqhQ
VPGEHSAAMLLQEKKVFRLRLLPVVLSALFTLLQFDLDACEEQKVIQLMKCYCIINIFIASSFQEPGMPIPQHLNF